MTKQFNPKPAPNGVKRRSVVYGNIFLWLFLLLCVAYSHQAIAQTTITSKVLASTDDAEEDGSGVIDLTSTDLELIQEGSANVQTVGMRFNNIAIPAGATITNAFIEFIVDETDNLDPSALTISGQDADNATTFTSTSGDISSRTKTTNTTAWNSEPQWTVVGATKQTPNISSVIQEIYDRAGWVSGNSMVIIIEGSGRRVAEAYDAGSALAPLLSITYSTAPPISLSATPTDEVCPGTGAIAVTVTGGTAPYSYSWTNDIGGSGSGNSSSNPFDITGLDAATYTVDVTDNLGSMDQLTNIVVGSPAALSLSLNATYLSAPGASDGAIDLTVSGGVPLGGPSYTYAWTKDGSAYASTEDLSGLSAGTYEVTVTDNCGTAVSSLLMTSAVTKQLYLTNPSQGLDRIDPVATGDATNSTTTILGGGTPELDMATYLGAGEADYIADIAIDASGYIYVCGQTLSTGFPTTSGAYDETHNGNYDAFVTKLNPAGTSVIWSTYIGGSDNDEGKGIDVDDSGNVYVWGQTASTDFPTVNAYDNTYGGSGDAYLAKLSANGGSLLYSTYLGGTNYEDGNNESLVVQGSTAYIQGITGSTDFPLMNAFDASLGGLRDIFITAINTSISGAGGLQFSTYVGGSAYDYAGGFDVDAAGNMYITGFRSSGIWTTPTSGAFDATANGDNDGFLLKLSPTGTKLYATWIGGNDYDAPNALTVDADGYVYLTGITQSTNFPVTSGAYDETGYALGNSDVFVVKMDLAGNGANDLVYSTYISGSNGEYGRAITVEEGIILVSGYSQSTDYPMVDEIQAYGGGYDIFLSRINPAGNGASDLIASTYIGGSDSEYGEAMALNASGDVILAGHTASSDFPVTAGAYDQTFGGGTVSYDGFVAMVGFDGTPSGTITVNSSSSASTPGSAGNLTWSHTITSGSNRILTASISLIGGQSTGVTYGGTAMTLVGRHTGSLSHTTEIWQLLAPPVGTANIVATFDASREANGGGIAFNGVHQTTPTGTFQGADGESATASVTVSSAAGEMVVDVLYIDASIAATAGAGQTERWNLDNGRVGAGSTEAGAASVEMSWSVGDEWNISAVSLKPAPSGVSTTLTFTQSPAMCSNLEIPLASTITASLYVNEVVGSITGSTDITATLKYGTTTIANLTNSGYSGGILTLAGPALLSTVPAGQAIVLDILNNEAGVTFTIDYDSQTNPSAIDILTAAYIDINSYAIYDAPYPGGNIITDGIINGTVYVRATVSDPFGYDDITALDLNITPTIGVVSAPSVATSGCTRTYEYEWNTPATGGTYNLEATAKEGFENTVTDVENISFDICSDCPPTANDDIGVVLVGGPAVSIDVLANDTDPNSNLNTASLSVISGPSFGTANVVAGEIVYTPGGSYAGTDQFTYQICDNTSPTPLCDIATVDVVAYVTKQLYLTDPSQGLDRVDPVGTGDATTVTSSVLGAGWLYKRKVTFNNAAQSENLSEFPVLIKLDDTRIDYGNTQNSGEDLRFYDSDDVTPLAFEIESWDEGGSSYVWVNVPQINGSSNADFIWMYYGNPAAIDGQNVNGTWNSGYVGVWHLNETSGTHYDATFNGNDGTAGGGLLQNTTGLLGGASDFDGTDDGISVTDNASLDLTSAMSVSAWIEPDNSNIYSRIAAKSHTSNADPYSMYGLYVHTTQSVILQLSNAGTNYATVGSTTLPLNTWSHVGGTFDGSVQKTFTNGVQDGINTSTSFNLETNNMPFTIGKAGFNQNYFDGKIDEVRVSNVVRSDDWNAAQYASMTDAFASYGAEQAGGGGAGTSISFTQGTAMCSNLDLPSGTTMNAQLYVNEIGGTITGSSNITAEVKYGTTTIANLTNSGYSGGVLTLSGTVLTSTIPAGEAVVLVITNNDSGVQFSIDYDSNTDPSRVEISTTSYIDIVSYAVYDAPYPGGSIITNTTGGTVVYPRAVVTDPFGNYDITGLDINISGSPVAATSVATSGCTRTFEYAWTTPAATGTFPIPATAKEGYENTVTDVQALDFDLCSPTVGVPAFTLGATSTRCQGAGSVTYTATSTNTTGITYSLDAASLTGGNTINSTTGEVTYVAGWNGLSTITASSDGCGGPITSDHVVTITPTVGTPVFDLGATSNRCQGAGTDTYSATATNSTGITYSLDATSLAAGNTINSSTGEVTYVAGWTGDAIITADATGCNGPSTETHTATTLLSVTTPVFSLGATSTRCQGAGSVTYSANASYTTGISYTLDATSLTAGNTINGTTGAVTYVEGWNGTSVITASAAGCNGPTTSTHTVTITPDGRVTFALGTNSNRSPAAGTVIYTATANNGGAITYSLDATSLAAGNTINSSTGEVTYTAVWVGTSVITASVNGCNGVQTATHNANTLNVVKQLYLSDPSQALDRIDPVATGDNTTSTSPALSLSPPGVTIDNTSTISSLTGPVIVSHNTGTGINRLMLVGISRKNYAVSSVTYGGVPLTLVGKEITNTNAVVELYKMVNPPSGTANVVVSFDATPTKGAIVGVMTFTGVDQTTPLGSFVSIYTNSSDPTINVPSAAGELVYDIVCKRNTQPSSAGAGQTVNWNIASGSEMNGASSTKPGTATTTMSWNAPTSSNQSIGAVSIRPSTLGAITTASFTENPALCSNLTIEDEAITVTNYVSIVSGSMPASPDITAVLKYGATNIITLSNPTYSSGSGTLTWTGTLGSSVTVPAGQAIELEITTNEAGVEFVINYDSETNPSVIDLPVSTYININSLAIYDAPYPGGNIITDGIINGTVYVRSVVSDPFGYDDITGLDLNITPVVGSVSASAVATSGCTKTYEYVWNTPATGGTYNIEATALEGYENSVTDVQSINFDICTDCPPFAIDDNAVAFVGGPAVSIDVLANDYDPNNNLDATSLTVVTPPSFGTAVVVAGQIQYTPNGSYTGTDQFTYQVCDLTTGTPLCDIATVDIVASVVKQLYLSDPSQSLDRIDPVATGDATTATTAEISTNATENILVDNTSTGSTISGSSVTISHTTGAGSNRLMLVGVTFQDRGEQVTSVTYGGTPLTFEGRQVAPQVDRGQVEIYSMVSPPSGTANVVVTFTGALGQGSVVGVTTFTGVDQSTSLGTFSGSNGSTTPASITGVASATGELVFGMACFRRSDSRTGGAGQTELWNLDSGHEVESAACTKPGAASVDISWTFPTNDQWAIGAIPIKPATMVSSATFTQSPALCSPLTITAAQTISVANYITVTSGTMPANPDLTAELKYGATNIITLTNPSYNSGTGILTWTGTLGTDVTVPSGQAIVLEITTAEAAADFTIEYDSQTKPSKVELSVSTFIDVNSFDIYDAAYPGGSIITGSGAAAGTTVYPRAVVSDPFGFADITAMDIFINPPGSTVSATSVATSSCTRTYEYVWNTPATDGTYALTATAEEGYEGTVTDASSLNFDLCPPIGDPVFDLGATSTTCQNSGTVTYTATSTLSTGISYALDAASLAGGNTINASTGAVTYAAGWTGTSTITATATGCAGPKSSDHTVTITPYVGTPVFTLGATSTRCQGAATISYGANATNTTGITYSLDATSLSAGNTINASTGAVTYTAGWSGDAVITATAAGCNGPTTATHTATTNLTVVAPVFDLGATSGRCTESPVTYTATSPNTTGITYSLDAVSLAAGHTINASTGQVTYAATWNGNTVITASAAGCNGPATSDHTVTLSTACPPEANDDAFAVALGNSGFLDILANDVDLNDDIDTNSIVITQEPINGSVIISGGIVIYVPNGNYLGIDVFTYMVCDQTSPSPLCDTAQVVVSVTGAIGDPCAEAILEHIYYLPYPENELRTALINSASASCGANIANVARSITNIKSPYPGVIITFDHWEDGYETNIKAPVQSTTEVWGDNNPSNGTAPGYPSDILPPGAGIILENDMLFNPRDPVDIYYDGKDKIHTTRDIALTKIAGDLGQFEIQAAKTDVYDTYRFGTSFTVQFGEDLPNEFQYTSTFIRASKDNTTVSVDKDNDGTIDESASLNEGEVLFIDGGIMSGAKITSTKPVGVDMLFGGLDCYGTRQIPILPAAYYGDVYYSPVPTTQASYPAAVYLNNSLNQTLTINYYSTNTSGTIDIMPKSTSRFVLSDDSGYKFVNLGGESFTAMEVIDSDASGARYDWSFNLITEERLTDFASVAWGPGSFDGSGNWNPVWVTPNANTTIYVKYDGNLTEQTAQMSPCGIPYDLAVPLNELEYYTIYDNSDNDQSGLAVYTCDGTKIAAVYGENPDDNGSLTPTGVGNGAIDVGTGIQPMCLDVLILANDDRTICPPNDSVIIPISNNDYAFLATVDVTSIETEGLNQPANGSVTVHNDGTVTYTPNPGWSGIDTFEYSICTEEYASICDIAEVIVIVTACNATPNENLVNGYVYLELAPDNGAYDGEDVLEGIQVHLIGDENCNGIADPSELIIETDVTDLNGMYSFSTINGEFVKDDFDDPLTLDAGNDGSVSWDNDWQEIGETNGFGTSAIFVGTDAADGDRSLLLNGASNGASRQITFDGATGALLDFEYKRVGLENSGEELEVRFNGNTIFWINDGNGVGTNQYYIPVQLPIAYGDINPNGVNTLEFRTNSATSDGDYFYIDNIKVTFNTAQVCFVTQVDVSDLNGAYLRATLDEAATSFSALGTCANDLYLGVLPNIVAVDNSSFGGVDEQQDIDIVTNDIGLVDETTVTITSTTSNGSVSVNPDGSTVYTPDPGYTGLDQFDYEICSQEDPLVCDTATVYITVSCLVVVDSNAITGSVFNDFNENTVFDAGEALLSGIQVHLYEDENDNGILDGTEGVTPLATTTSVDGGYQFVQVGPIGPLTNISIPITLSSDDATEEDNTAMDNSNSKLELKNSRLYVGMRFQNVTIPAGATISNAYITFTASDDRNAVTDLEISIHDDDQPPTFLETDGNISSRWSAGNTVSWNNVEEWSKNTQHNSPDLTDLVQHLVDRGDWNSGDHMAILVHWLQGERKALSYDDDPLNAPVLNISYQVNEYPVSYITQVDVSTLPYGGYPTTSVEQAVTFSFVTESSCGNFSGIARNTTAAINDINVTLQNTPVSGNIMRNEIDVEGHGVTFGNYLQQNYNIPITNEGGATVLGVDPQGNTVNNAGTFSFDVATGDYNFVPATDFTGDVTLRYSMCDNGTVAVCDTGSLTIAVNYFPNPSDPTTNDVEAVNDYNTSYGEPVHGNILDGDGDPEEDNVIIQGLEMDVFNSTNGAADLNRNYFISGVDEYGEYWDKAGRINIKNNGDYTFIPFNGFVGKTQVTYTICDDFEQGYAACDEAVVTIEVLIDKDENGNDAPFAGDDFIGTLMNKPVTANWASNDRDDNGDNVKLNSSNFPIDLDNLSGPVPLGTYTTEKGGNLQMFKNGTLTYTPPQGFFGPDQFPYRICDVTPEALCDSATLYFLVSPIYYDFGDLPSQFPTAANMIPIDFNVDGTPDMPISIWFGDKVDAELATLDGGGTAQGDDGDGFSDEEGLVLPQWEGGWSNYTGGPDHNEADFGIIVNGTDPGMEVYFGLWIDWEFDGTFDYFYQGLGYTQDNNLRNQDTLYVSVPLPPSISSSSQVGVRLRAFQSAPNASQFGGAIRAGEVEDHIWYASSLLPVELTYFDAEALENDAYLSWQTASEINNDYFSVQRSEDGLNWEEIGIVEGHGNSTQVHDYELIDEDLRAGVYYYRLQQFDYDGSSEYSEIRSVEIFAGGPDQVNQYEVYPVPVHTSGSLKIDGLEQDAVQVRIHALNGSEAVFIPAMEGGVLPIAPFSLTPGIYILEVHDGGSTFSKKIMVFE